MVDRVAPETPLASNALAPTMYEPSSTAPCGSVVPSVPSCQSQLHIVPEPVPDSRVAPFTDHATVAAGRDVVALKDTEVVASEVMTPVLCGAPTTSESIATPEAEPGFGTVVDCSA